MPINSATFEMTVSANANETVASTTRVATTGKRDRVAYTNGTGSNQITGVVDAPVTISANSTVTALSTLQDTLEGAWAYTSVKGYRIATPAANVGNVTVTSNITGFPSGMVLHPNSSIGGRSNLSTGLTVTGANTITCAGVNSDKVNITLYVS